FFQVPYETSVPEDTPLGTTIFTGIYVEDPDILGDTLEVVCYDKSEEQAGFSPCTKFEIVTLNATSRRYEGAVVLRESLDYSKKHLHQLILNATTLNSSPIK
ncbi:unnamed protein product, partial [Timema podura]|nr:unnamed protein product [Timema podura]